ncbi:hypothetical protein AO724_19940 [Aeromonas allosaccharophila]|uniref:hypothetical protein n=1 Tax=Aeromonas allosaccharophila TaxID=656 RepID=UPI0007180672|nr:hypothetical protein [Aeromonas allosaccharophila]KRW54696.1 hypothetical protein AO724_19940 [Aeromonas allosaccharophila]
MLNENIKRFIKSKWNMALAFGTIIVSLAASLGNINDAIDVITSWLPRKKNIAVVQARLEPFPIKKGFGKERDDVFLMMSIRNYSMLPIMIVSGDVEGHGSSLIGKGKAGRQGICILSSSENNNEPLTIKPGKTVWIKVGNSIHLSGLSRMMSNVNFQDIHLFEPDTGVGIHEVYFVKILNDLLANKYGQDAEIIANIYTGEERKKHSFSFYITQGTDLFSKDGTLQHDWFLAQWIRPINQPQFEINDNCEVK